MKFQRVGRVNIVLHLIGILFLKFLGWKVEGTPPAAPKYVVIVAPHTSYWDFPMALGISWVYRMKGAWFGKSDIFHWPILKYLFRNVGGIPVYRNRNQGLVSEAVRVFAERDALVLALAPEGTRAKVDYWKSGFYRVALQADVPIALGFLDYKRKVGGFGPLYHCTGDQETDLAFIQEFYNTVTPRHEERRSEVRFRPNEFDPKKDRHDDATPLSKAVGMD